MKNTGSTTKMLKAKFSNRVHDIINPTPVKGARPQAPQSIMRKMTDAEKITMLENLLQAHFEASHELRNYFNNRKDRKRIQKLRDAKIVTGNKPPKHKTSKEEWLAMQKQAA